LETLLNSVLPHRKRLLDGKRYEENAPLTKYHTNINNACTNINPKNNKTERGFHPALLLRRGRTRT
jgi:hypothetical protein